MTPRHGDGIGKAEVVDLSPGKASSLGSLEAPGKSFRTEDNALGWGGKTALYDLHQLYY